MVPFSCTYLLFLLRSEEGTDRPFYNLDQSILDLNSKRKNREGDFRVKNLETSGLIIQHFHSGTRSG
jgi:hypothetical protein